MNDKLRESIHYLKSLSFIENEAFKLYETLSKKINQPESSFIFGIGCDSLKNAKIIQGILDRFD
jgi:acyl carrier protein